MGFHALTEARMARMSMSYFITCLLFYVFNEVVEPCWMIMDDKLRKVKTVDELMDTHNDFLQTVMEKLTLNDKNIRSTLLHILQRVLYFCSYV